MSRTAVCITIMLAIIASVSYVHAAAPTIIVYTGSDSEFARMLAELIEDDERIDSEIRVVNSADLVILAAAMPQTECIIIYTSNKVEIEGLEDTLLSYFQQGGGLVGMREICYQPSAGELATRLFPVMANTSVQQLSPREKRVRIYVTDRETEINQGLPDTFEILSMGTYYKGDARDEYMDVHSNYTVPYRDQETGSPLVLAYQNEKGGRSVALPGIWVIPSERLDVYYGKLVEEPNFVQLFTNSVLWAAKGSSRYEEVQQDLDQKIMDAETRQDRLKEEADEARREEKTRRQVILAVLWAAGLVGCALIAKKMVLVPVEE